MPIYEFYCPDCHTIFNFLARSPSKKRPNCPRCARKRLERKVSAFAISRGRKEAETSVGDPLANVDEARIEQAMAEMTREVEGLDESDPRQMAGVMRKLFDRTGMPVSPHMDEAIRRMESGEDPDRIEEEMGDLLEGDLGEIDDMEGAGRLGRLGRRLRAPTVDDTLYEL